MKRLCLCTILALFTCMVLCVGASVGAPILSGQSNMEGLAAVTTLDAVLNNPAHEHRDTIKHLKRDDQWVQRDDVFFTYLDRTPTELSPAHGPLNKA